MLKLKKAFTMAEVLVALGVLGVLTAMVLPGIVKNNQKHFSGAILGRAVAQIEQGNKNIIQTANLNNENGNYYEVMGLITRGDILGATANQVLKIIDFGNFEQLVMGFWGLEPTEIPVNSVKTIKNFDGTEISADDTKFILTNGRRYNFTKLPASVAICSTALNVGAENINRLGDIDFDIPHIFIYIDTTGLTKPPNVFGKDIFLFTLKNNGNLVPWSTVRGDRGGLEHTADVVRDGFRITYY